MLENFFRFLQKNVRELSSPLRGRRSLASFLVIPTTGSLPLWRVHVMIRSDLWGDVSLVGDELTSFQFYLHILLTFRNSHI